MEKIDSRIILNEASVAGLVFGVVSGGYCFIPSSKFGIVLTLVKIVGLVMLMKWWMTRLCTRYEGVSNKDTLRFGTWTALFSALITGLCFYFSALRLDPEQLGALVDTALQSYPSVKMNADQASLMDDIMTHIPAYGLASNIIYCFLYGRILSRILSSNIPSRNPFAGGQKDESDDDII